MIRKTASTKYVQVELSKDAKSDLTLETVKADTDIASAISLKHSNSLDHSHANKSALDLVSGTNTGDQDLSNLVVKEAGKSLVADTEIAKIHAPGSDNETASSIAIIIDGTTAKTPLVDTDTFPLTEPTTLKKTLWSTIKSTLKTYFDTLYATISSLASYIPYTGGTSNVDLGIHNLTVDTNSLFVDATNHRVGIGTPAPDKRLEINSVDGNNLRLTYNDNNGSATYYVDFLVSSSGDLIITPSGGDIEIGSANIHTTGALKGVHKANDGTNAVADGTYTVGIGTTTNGTITIKDGIITAVQQAT